MYELYYTRLGHAYVGDSRELLASLNKCSVNLVVTSPPFALQRKKEYGNKAQDEYVDWLLEFAHSVFEVLKEDGSFVLDLGGAYKKGRPVRSLYNYRVLLRICDECGFNLAEEFFWHNPAKLPSPIEWVNKRSKILNTSINQRNDLLDMISLELLLRPLITALFLPTYCNFQTLAVTLDTRDYAKNYQQRDTLLDFHRNCLRFSLIS